MERLQEIRAKYQPVVDKERNSLRTCQGTIPRIRRSRVGQICGVIVLQVLSMAAVIDFLFSRPVLSVRQASDGLGIPFKTARDYLTKLVQAGVLREITGYPRNRIFQADEILRAVQGNDLHTT